MKANNKKVGGLGEGIAARFLEGKGHRVLERSYSKSWGEVDLITMKGDVIHFVEVKSVTREPGSTFSREMLPEPEEKVDERKISKIQRVAEYYLSEKYPRMEAQIDVIAVFLDLDMKKAMCRLSENVL